MSDDTIITKLAALGSVSSGTLRTPDLLRTFAGLLQTLDVMNHREPVNAALVIEARFLAQVIDNGDEDMPSFERAHEVLDAVIDALDVYAPEGAYFGAHEGDGADFGFWPTGDFED